VSSCFIGLLISKLTPQIVSYTVKTRGKRARREVRRKVKAGLYTRILILLLLVAIFANTGYTAYTEYSLNSKILYTFKAGVSGVNAVTDSWYKAVETIKSTPPGSLVISWWDYGYGISVLGERASAADGSTINNTQIGIIGLILLSNTSEQAAKLAKLLGAKSNTTFLMVIEGLFISDLGNETVIWPITGGGAIPGIVDWPKSIWMIRIGNSVVEELNNKGVNVSYIETEGFLYLYNFAGGVLAPQFNNPINTPLIYRIIVDAALYWASNTNKIARFCWFTGTTQPLDYSTRQRIQDTLRLNITTMINPGDISCTVERPLLGDTYLEPYAVIIEPFKNPETGEPLQANYMNYSGIIYSVIVIYRFTTIPGE